MFQDPEDLRPLGEVPPGVDGRPEAQEYRTDRLGGRGGGSDIAGVSSVFRVGSRAGESAVAAVGSGRTGLREGDWDTRRFGPREAGRQVAGRAAAVVWRGWQERELCGGSA